MAMDPVDDSPTAAAPTPTPTAAAPTAAAPTPTPTAAAPKEPIKNKPTTLQEALQRLDALEEENTNLKKSLSQRPSSNAGGEQPSVGASMAKGAALGFGAWVFLGAMSLIPPWPLGFVLGLLAIGLFMAAPKIIENVKNWWNSASEAPVSALEAHNPASNASNVQIDELRNSPVVDNKAVDPISDPLSITAAAEPTPTPTAAAPTAAAPTPTPTAAAPTPTAAAPTAAAPKPDALTVTAAVATAPLGNTNIDSNIQKKRDIGKYD